MTPSAPLLTSISCGAVPSLPLFFGTGAAIWNLLRNYGALSPSFLASSDLLEYKDKAISTSDKLKDKKESQQISESKTLGQVFTPYDVAKHMVEMSFYEFVRLNNKYPESWLDPACGNGVFFRAIKDFYNEMLLSDIHPPELFGIDIDPEVLQETKQNHPEVNLKQADFLKKSVSAKYDIIIGNPPYISVNNLTEEYREFLKSKFKVITGKPDIYMAFIEKSYYFLSETGILLFLLPDGWLFNKSGEGVISFLKSIQAQSEIFLIENKIFSQSVTNCLLIIRNGLPTEFITNRFIYQESKYAKIKLGE